MTCPHSSEPYDHVERRIARIKVHPKYNSKLKLRHYEYDLAMLKFDRPVQFSPNIIPVCLPNLDQEFGGQSGWATGWGDWKEREEDEANENTVTLREVNVPLKTVDQCGEDFDRKFGSEDHLTKLRTTHRIKSFFICADTTAITHGTYRDTCQAEWTTAVIRDHDVAPPAGSLWHKGACNRTMEATYPLCHKEPASKQNTPQ